MVARHNAGTGGDDAVDRWEAPVMVDALWEQKPVPCDLASAAGKPLKIEESQIDVNRSETSKYN